MLELIGRRLIDSEYFTTSYHVPPRLHCALHETNPYASQSSCGAIMSHPNCLLIGEVSMFIAVTARVGKFLKRFSGGNR